MKFALGFVTGVATTVGVFYYLGEHTNEVVTFVERVGAVTQDDKTPEPPVVHTNIDPITEQEADTP